MPEQITLEAINTSGGSQARAAMSADAVAEFAEAMRRGVDFPPVTVFKDGSTYWLADGFHRVVAAQQAGLETIRAEVRAGTLRDAILFAVGANAEHGLRRSNADKRKAVTILLTDAEWATRTNSWIAEQCRVSDKLVADVRNSVSDSRNTEGEQGSVSDSRNTDDEPESVSDSRNTQGDTRTGRDGKQYKAKKERLPRNQDGAAGGPDEQTSQIPEALQPYFAHVTLFEEAVRLAVRAADLFQEAEQTPAFLKAVAGRKHHVYSTTLRTAALTLTNLTPRCPCPSCSGAEEPFTNREPCRLCAGKGYQTAEEVGLPTMEEVSL
jgi:hypothetical protein